MIDTEQTAFDRCCAKWEALGMPHRQACSQASHERACRVKRAYEAGASIDDLAVRLFGWRFRKAIVEMLKDAGRRSPADKFLAHGALHVAEMAEALR